MAPPNTRVESYRVRSYEVDPGGRLRLVTLAQMMQEAAWQHAKELGKGFAHKDGESLYWVLSRLRLRLDRLPRWGDSFAIHTWPVGTERLLAVREFQIIHGDGSTIGRAVTGWLIVDSGTGRPIRPERHVGDLLTRAGEMNEPLAKLPEIQGAEPCREVVPRNHDIDQYEHVNNAAYLEWFLDCHDPDFHRARCANMLAIDFYRETRFGTKTTVLTAARADDGWRYEALHEDGAAAARAHILWSPL